MASPGGGTSTGSSSLQRQSSSGGSEQEEVHLIMDERKRKRMQSNRESARRSRMRKQQHLDDLMSQVTNLRKENSQLLTNMNLTTQHYLKIDAENSVLRAQMDELRNRLQSLEEIIDVMNGMSSGAAAAAGSGGVGDGSLFGNNEEELCGGLVGGAGTGQFLGTGFGAGGGGDAGSFMMNHWSSSVYLNQPIMASASDIFQY